MAHYAKTGQRLIPLAIVAIAGAVFSAGALAQDIQVKLNLIYANPLDPNSGGDWELVAKSSPGNFGIAALEVYLAGIVQPPSEPIGPRGTVNAAGNPAGFSQLVAFSSSPGVTGIVIGQTPVAFPQTEQSIFYGVGRLPEGHPGDVGPQFTTLTNVQAVPWGSSDFFNATGWENAVLLARGDFLPGFNPMFSSQAGNFTRGSVYTSLPMDPLSVGMQSLATAAATFVEHNLGASPDYNGDGKVDAGDYVLWRNTLGNMAPDDIRADGNGNGTVDIGDYTVWKNNYGQMPGMGGGGLAGPAFPGPGAAGGSAVPEPASILLLAGASAVLFLRPKTRVLRHVNGA